MMRGIIAWSLKYRVFVLVVAVGLIVFGAVQLRNMPVDALPEFDPPRVEIQTEALGLSATEVEQLITVPLESDLLNGVAWLDTIRSESVPGLSRVELIFEPGTDIMRARQLVQERLIQAPTHLSKVSKAPQMIQPLSSTSRVMEVGLSSDQLSLIRMSVLARWTIRPVLLGVPGVANVSIFGQRERQLQVQVDPEHLRDEGVALSQVISTTGNSLWVSPLSFLEASSPGTGGFFDTPNQRLGIRHVLPIADAKDLARVPVEGADGTRVVGPDGNPLRLGEVSNVVEDHQPLIGDALDERGSGLMLVIEKFPWANTVEVTDGVESALDRMQQGLPGVRIDSSIFRPASYIEQGFNNLGLMMLVALALVFLLLLALFYRWRTVAICVVAIPVSLLAAVVVLYLRGATLNGMVLAGLVIALGVLIDDAVVDTENVASRIREHREKGGDKSLPRVIFEASLETRSTLMYATLIILLAVAPVFLLEGLSGSFFRPLALSYALAVVASMIVALTVVPALSLVLLSRLPAERRELRLLGWLRRSYESSLGRVIKRPRPLFIAAGAIMLVGLVVGFALLPQNGESLLPSFRERDVLVHWDGAPGTSLPEMQRISGLASEELRSLPGVRNVGAHMGRAILSDQIVGINSSELWVSIDPDADYDRTLTSIQNVVAGYPGLAGEVLTYQQDQIREVLTGSEDDMVVRIYGADLAILRDKAEEIRQSLSNIDGIVNPNVQIGAEEPTVEIKVDLEEAQRVGISPGNVRRAAATLLQGLEVGNLFEQQKVFEVVVVGMPVLRHSLTEIDNLLIDTPSGGHVRLGDVAEVRVAPNPNIISHEAVSRNIDIGAGLEGRDAGAVAADVRRAIDQINFPLEYHAEILGEYAERQAAQSRMLAFAAAAAIGIFLLLQAAFGSWRLASIAFLSLPLALAGGVAAAFIDGGPITLGTLVGCFTVVGIAARNGMVLLKRYQKLQREGDAVGPDLVLRGARERFGPILFTALATALALLPFVLGGNIPGLEIVQPMAAVVLGGLTTTTFLNLFVVPALYLMFGASTGPAMEREVDVDIRELSAAA
jgi:CzcA family heavy metal efflux pump